MGSDDKRLRSALQTTRPRSGGWTTAKRRRFLEALAMTCNVERSCKAVKMGTTGVYKLRGKDAAFRAGWADAIAIGVDRLELLLLERATNGRVTLKIAADGARTRVIDYPDHIAMQLIRNHKADRPAETGDDEAQLEALHVKILRKLDLVARREAKRDGASDTEAGGAVSGGAVSDEAVSHEVGVEVREIAA